MMNLGRLQGRAKQVEDAIRERAMLPVNLEINGIEVKHLNLEHWTILTALRSPFFVGGRIPDASDICIFLWIVSPHYDPHSYGTAYGVVAKVKRWLAERRRRLFIQRIVRHPRWLNFEPRIRKYLNRAFMDRPASSSSGKQIAAGLGASMIHRLAYTYHCSREEIRQMPLSEVFQYLNWINANQPQFNPIQAAVVTRMYDRQEAEKRNGVTHGG